MPSSGKTEEGSLGVRWKPPPLVGLRCLGNQHLFKQTLGADGSPPLPGRVVWPGVTDTVQVGRDLMCKMFVFRVGSKSPRAR